MRDEDFSVTAKDLMGDRLFNDSSRDGGISWSAEMIETYLRCEGQCVYCGRDMLENYIVHTFDAEREHLLPATVYPELENEKSNWVVACHSCNKVKGTLDVNDGYGERRYVKGSAKPLTNEDRRIFVERVNQVNKAYSKKYDETFARQKQILLGILAGNRRAKAAAGSGSTD